MSISQNEAYLLGILYGKGSIIEVDNEVILLFRVRFRRPTDASIRSDNIHTVVTQREYIESLKSKLTNNFSSIMRILSDTWNISSEIDLPNSYSLDDWKMKQITITSQKISKDFAPLTQLLHTKELNNDSLKKFPFYLNMENSKPIALAFIQGICDSCSLVPNEASSDHGGQGEARIQLEPSQERWETPIGLCRLFQIGLGIPVNNINWGHPQIRGKRVWRNQNHQFRVKLKNIPPEMELYRLEYKREEYNNLYQRNVAKFEKGKLCPHSKRIIPGAEIHLNRSYKEDLNDELIEKRIRGIDINVKYKTSLCICKLMGCTQCEQYYKVEVEED